MDAGEYAVKNSNKVIMVISAVERQAYLLFEKILGHIYDNHRKLIKMGKDRPTKSKLTLTNGSVIHCLPTGEDGYGIRGFTIDRLYADEAAFIKEQVWAAVTPMLATTGGDIILLSTPMGRENYFFRAFHSEHFTSFHVSSIDVAESREEPQRTNMLNHFEEEKQRMSKLQYQQEYLGLFVGGIERLYSDELIESMVSPKTSFSIQCSSRGDNFCGVDVARMGGDESVIVSLNQNNGSLTMVDLEIPQPQMLTATARLILHKNGLYDYKKIYIDTTGMGWGVYDPLYEDHRTRKKVVSIENAKKIIDKLKGQETTRKKTVMKDELYLNLKMLMENKKIKVWDTPELVQSLRSIQVDNTEGKMHIFGNYTHIAEALIRAAWCVKDKSLNLWCY